MKKHSPRFLALVNEIKPLIKELSADDYLMDTNAYILVDVREDREFSAAHVEGARHIGKGVLERDIEKQYPTLHTPLVLYCGGGFRSALAADILGQMGYTQVYSLAGGFRALRAAGASIVSQE